MKLSPLNRVLLLITGILASYQVAVGINGFDTVPIITYTIAFGVLLVACLLLIIWGFDVLDSPVVIIVSTTIPLAIATGLIHQHLASFQTSYLLFAIVGFIAVTWTRLFHSPGKTPTIVLAFVHGIAAITIFLLPIIVTIQEKTQPLFVLVSVGGALISIGCLLLAFLKTGKPVLSREKIFKVLPSLLTLMMICFVAGFEFG